MLLHYLSRALRSRRDAGRGRRVRRVAARLQTEGNGRAAGVVRQRPTGRAAGRPGELLVRAGFADRERLLAAHPTTFGVPPLYEKHMKVQVLLDGDAKAIREAIRLAWEMQRR